MQLYHRSPRVHFLTAEVVKCICQWWNQTELINSYLKKKKKKKKKKLCNLFINCVKNNKSKLSVSRRNTMMVEWDYVGMIWIIRLLETVMDWEYVAVSLVVFHNLITFHRLKVHLHGNWRLVVVYFPFYATYYSYICLIALVTSYSWVASLLKEPYDKLVSAIYLWAVCNVTWKMRLPCVSQVSFILGPFCRGLAFIWQHFFI